MFLSHVLLKVLWGLVFLSALWPGASDDNVEVTPGMVELGVFVLGPRISSSTVEVSFGNHLTAGLVGFFHIPNSGTEVLF